MRKLFVLNQYRVKPLFLAILRNICLQLTKCFALFTIIRFYWHFGHTQWRSYIISCLAVSAVTQEPLWVFSIVLDKGRKCHRYNLERNYCLHEKAGNPYFGVFFEVAWIFIQIISKDFSSFVFKQNLVLLITPGRLHICKSHILGVY